MNTKIILISLIISIIFISACTNLTSEVIKEKEESIKIGAVLPLSGDSAFYGESAKQGIDVAVKEINSAGGINNKKVEVVYEDSEGTSKGGVSALSKLIHIDQTEAVIGAVASSVTLAIAPIAEQNKVVLISPLSAAPSITNAGDFIFRNVPSDNLGGKVAAYFAINGKNWDSIAILYINNEFGKGLKTAFSENIKKLGGKVIIEQAYPEDEKDFKTYITKIKESTPDAIFLISYTEVPLILTQSKELGLDYSFFGTGLLEDPNLIENAGELAEGIYFTQLQYTTDMENSATQKFVINFKNKFGVEPNILCAYAYDSMKVLTNAIENVGVYSAEEIKQELYNTKNYNAATGLISFDENGDVNQPMGVKIIKEGKFEWYIKEIAMT